MDKLTKKEILDKLKISIFEKNAYNTNILACEIIVNGHVKALMQTMIELWSKFYIYSSEIALLIQEVIDNIANIKPKEIYKHTIIRVLIVKLCFVMCKTSKFQVNFHITNITADKVNDVLVSSNQLSSFNCLLLQKIEAHLDDDNFNYIVSLLYYFSKKNVREFNKILSYIVEKFVKSKQLTVDCETVHLSLSKNYVWLIIAMLKLIYIKLDNDNMTQYYSIYTKIFEYSLTKSDIMKRINIIFLLFNMLINKNMVRQIEEQPIYQDIVDISEIDKIFEKLIDFYNLDMEIRINKKASKLNNDTNEADDIIDSVDNTAKKKNNKAVFNHEDINYLYTLTYTDPRLTYKKNKNVEYALHDNMIPIKMVEVKNYDEKSNLHNIDISKLI